MAELVAALPSWEILRGRLLELLTLFVLCVVVLRLRRG